MSHRPLSAYWKHGFTLCLLGVLVLAWFIPQPGAPGGWLQPEWTTKLGVWVIFFLQGISLPTRELAAGYQPIRLQAFVLGWNYLLFPLVAFLSLVWLTHFLPEDVAMGFRLLSVLPTTIASAVAFTSLAGGRTASALCATALSNLLAVVAVPLWVALYLRTGASVELPLWPLLSKLALLIVFPLLLGQLLRRFGKKIAAAFRPWARRASSGIILFIIYAAFAGSVASGLFQSFSAFDLILIFFLVAALLLLVSGAVWFSAGWLRLTAGDRIAAFFCASQKSLATGLPLATAIFAVLPETIVVNSGAVLLPLIVYHPLQLLLAAVYAERHQT